MAQAKASGEFDGASITVKSVSESTASGGSNVVTFSDGKTLTVKNGEQGGKGDPGATPVRGVDYWTAADQESVVQDVIAALGTPVFGRVDEYNNITLTGALADGTYTIKYEDAEGNTTEIGTLNHEAAEPSLPNLIKRSVEVDGTTPYNGGQGYKLGYRINSSGGETGAPGLSCTGFIPIENDNIKNKYYLENIFGDDTSSTGITLYDENCQPVKRPMGSYDEFKISFKMLKTIANSADAIKDGVTYAEGDTIQCLSFSPYALSWFLTVDIVKNARYFRITSVGNMDDSCKVIFKGETV